MNIIVFSPTSTNLTLDPDQPLGGADSGLLKMIEVLSKEHDVKAFIPVKKETTYHDAEVLPFNSIFDFDIECDIIIHYRRIWAIPNTLKYRHAVFYSQDTGDTPCFAGLKGNRNFLNMYSKVFVLSDYHKQDMKKICDLPNEKYFILGNAAEEKEACGEKEDLTFIYASTPFRGLEVLLKAWTKIIVKYPTAKLHVFSSMKIYGAEQLDDLHFGKMFEDLRNGRFKNLIFHGSTSQKEMHEVMKKSYMLLYPNTYPETYCNVLMEARACRTPFITTDLGALKETGGDAGVFIEGKARTPVYLDRFLDALDFVIEHPETYKELQNNCYPIRTFKDYEKDLLSEIKEINIGGLNKK